MSDPLEAIDVGAAQAPLPFEDVFENAALAMAVLGDDGRVHAANRAGRCVLGRPGPLSGAGGRLHAVRPEEDARLNEALAEASGRPGPVTVTLRDGAEALRCELGRIDRTAAGDAARLLLTATPVEREAPLGPLLSERFGLTASEARLAGHLASGRDLRAAAQAMGVSRHTARKYLQIAFSKMGVRRQADLVRRALETARAEAG